ncbi:MarC family protein [Roseitranquillus sediminis]|uniref:MarC family protein n=1 Tax=Roseitranquillus sediminis TaxID=2809051 RepID=UPI001D0C0439|nr:MarC family protein [Roseitranquillus sediminis]MBM9594376.1 MarC family protein [Roseitranquillus sediminis]
MTTPELLSAFATLFLVIDPIGLAPLYVALTVGRTAAERREIALRSCGIAAFVLVLFGFLGADLLQFVGISMPAFRIAGGALLFLTALDMLFERRSKRREGQAEGERNADDPSVFPLATPLIAGPGAIAAMILLSGAAEDPSLVDRLMPQLVMLAVIALVFAMFMAAGLIERLLGATGIEVVTRLLGMLLAALAVQFILDGLADFGFAAPFAGAVEVAYGRP